MTIENRSSVQASILCTFLNAEGTLLDLVHSLARQTHRDFVCVLVDDGSTDRSLEIAESAMRRDGRFMVARNPCPGRGRALNLGLSYAEGGIVAVLDADDVAHPSWLARSLVAISPDENVAVLGCEVVPFAGNGKPLWPLGITDCRLPPYRDVTQALCRYNPISHSGALIRRKAVEEVGGYDTARNSQFDYDLWVRIAAGGGRIGKIGIPIVGKRIHAGQHFERPNHLSYVLSSLSVQRRAVKHLGSRPKHYPWLLARLAWSFTPRSIRMAIRSAARNGDTR